MNEITRIITPCRCGKCIYCEFGGNPPPQIIEKETACGDYERKDKLIEQMREALEMIEQMLEALENIRDYPGHIDYTTGEVHSMQEIAIAALAAERGE